jgi:replication-associated recombination protein RarA
MENDLMLSSQPAAPPDSSALQSGFEFPPSLTEKYQPRDLSQFVGLEKARKIAAHLIARPTSGAWLYVGPSGTGKTVMGLVIAAMMPAELHHIASKDCTLDAVNRVAARCHTMPHDAWDISRPCKMHLVLVDEADQMTAGAQTAFLSLLDATEFPPNTIFIFTCNSTDGLEARFLSRCHVVEFSSYGIAAPAADLLKAVWEKETSAMPDAPAPNFARILKDAKNNVRAALMTLETEIMSA